MTEPVAPLRSHANIRVEQEGYVTTVTIDRPEAKNACTGIMWVALGEVFREALGDKAGVRRFASVAVPLDEALVEVALDLSGRPYLHYEIAFPGEKILGDPPFDPQLVEEFWRAFVVSSAITLHLTSVRGRNTHHIIEATFKGAARALRDAVRVEGTAVPSTKGVL